MSKQIFTTAEVAKLCKVAPRTVSKWFDNGRLRGYRIPGSQDRRIPREHLIRFLKEHGMTGAIEDLTGEECTPNPAVRARTNREKPVPDEPWDDEFMNEMGGQAVQTDVGNIEWQFGKGVCVSETGCLFIGHPEFGGVATKQKLTQLLSSLNLRPHDPLI